jgi:hypothetical protein
MLQLKNKNLVVVVVGCSGSGKSTFAIRYLLNGKFSVRFIFDPRGEYAVRFKRRPCRVAAELRAAISTGYVIFDPHTLFPGEPQRAFEMFCDWSWTMSEKISGQKILFADEVWKFCSPNLIPKALSQIIQDGRKSGIGLLATTQRPNRLNEAIIGEATELVSFRLVGDNATDYLRKNCPEFPIDGGKDEIGIIQPGVTQLPLLHYIAQNLESGGLARGVLKF